MILSKSQKRSGGDLDNMRKVRLSMKEELKYETIKNLVEKKGNKKRAAVTLGISTRQVNRLIITYTTKGKDGFVHKNKGRQSVNSFPPELSTSILNLYIGKYQGFNFNHFKDMLLLDESIDVSYSFIYRLLMKNGIVSTEANRETKRRIERERKKKDRPNLSESEIEEEIKHEVLIEASHPRKERKKYFGEEIQMDGSIHLWFGSIKTCLHLAIDNCTGKIVGAYFDYEETLFGYYNVLSQILTHYGIPFSIKTDNRTIFNYIKETYKKDHQDVLTQFGYACKQLGISLKTTSVSQSKGQIERANGTFQRRLVNEFKLRGITTIKEANKYLEDVFLPFHNNKFALSEKNFESVFESKPDKNFINYTLAVLSARKFDNGSSIKYLKHSYQAYDEKGDLKCFLPKTECLVIKAFDNNLFVSVDNNVYSLKECQTHAKESENFDYCEVKERKKSNYIPPMSHPWKRSSFLAHQENAHKHHIFT